MIPRLTAKEIRVIVEKMVAGEVYTSDDLGWDVFLPLQFAGESLTLSERRKVGAAIATREDAIYQDRLCFHRCRLIHKLDWRVIRAAFGKQVERGSCFRKAG